MYIQLALTSQLQYAWLPIFKKKPCVGKNLKTKCYCNSYLPGRHDYKRIYQVI